MIRNLRKPRTILTFVAMIAVLAVACSSDDPEPTPTTEPSGNIQIFFPFIFSGQFTVAGEPGPQGVPMFAKLGDGRGLFNNSIRPGEYINVSVAPETEADVGGEITFFLGHPDGPTVQAEETYTYDRITEPQIIELDLTFPRLP